MGRNHTHKERKELKLPFEKVERDSIPGDELYDAIVCSIQALPEYTVNHSESRHEINGFRNDTALSRFLPGASTVSISTEVAPSSEYSHLTANISTQKPDEIDEIYNEVRDLEDNIASYFDPDENLVTDQNLYRAPETSLKAVYSYLSKL